MDKPVAIRPESPADHETVYAINAAAFETDAEAKLVDRLRTEADPVISLVAESGGEIAGHILFSQVALENNADVLIMGLAPMAVLPDYQKEGIGSALVRAGLDSCNKLGAGAVVVLGHPDYYPRFGFVPASRFGIHSDYDVPDEVFMALELIPEYLNGCAGKICYLQAFNDL